jgi:glutamine synthetase
MAKLEYIWLDGVVPTQGLRSKTKIITNFTGQLDDVPDWSFDGSSTGQAPGGSSDCILQPVYLVRDPQRKDGWLVMCEVLEANGVPHLSNGRSTIQDDDEDFWFGFEQEYFLWNPSTKKPLGFPIEGQPAPQGAYYCSVGANNAFGRNIVEEHLDACLEAGLNIEGINGEVAPGQWEFQIFAKGAKSAGDQVWLARYLLERISEQHGIAINWHCKPMGDKDWNGSGMHANFSNTTLRTAGSQAVFTKICEAFRPVVKAHLDAYGADNHLRLTGKHETGSINDFSYGISDREASIRIPVDVVRKGWYGYLEDRRPNSSADPYKVASVIISTIRSVDRAQFISQYGPAAYTLG